MAAEAAASEQQAGQATTQPAPVANQAAAAPASSESAKEDKKEGAKKEGGLAQDADAAGNVRDLPPTTPRPTLQLPPGYVLRRDPGFDVFRERNSIDDLPSYPDLPPYTYPGPVSVPFRPGTSTLAPENQQPSSPLDRAAAWSVAVADIEALQRKQYEEDLAKMEDQNEDEWTDEESVAAPEDDIARAESLQRDADFEELNRQFYRRFSQSRRSGRGDESSRRGPDGRSRSPVR